MDDNGCFSATCGKQKSQDIAQAKQCTIKKTVTEDVDGCKFIKQAAYICGNELTESFRVGEASGQPDGLR